MSDKRLAITAAFAVLRSALWGAGIPVALSVLLLVAYAIFPGAMVAGVFLIYGPGILLGNLGIPNPALSGSGNWSLGGALLINCLWGAVLFALIRLVWELLRLTSREPGAKAQLEKELTQCPDAMAARSRPSPQTYGLGHFLA